MIYYTTLTNTALAKISAALAAGTTLTMAQMAVGDGNGTTPNPTPASTGLVHEVYRANVNQVAVNQDGYLVAEMIIPMDDGGFAIREIALYDNAGALFAIGNMPTIEKPDITDNSVGELVLRMIVAISNASVINLTINGTLVTATQDWVEANFNLSALLPGGTTGQILRKRSNTDGDTEWADPTSVNVVVNTREETQTLVANQTVVDLTTTSTTGLAVYIDGIRLPRSLYTVNTATRITLSTSYPAGTLITLVQNEPAAQLQAIPIGMTIMLGVTATPAQLFGYGTWERVAEGKAIFGQSSADTDFDTLAKTGGSKTHTHSGSTATAGSHNHSGSSAAGGSHNHGGKTGSTILTVDQMPAHTHSWYGASLSTFANGSAKEGYEYYGTGDQTTSTGGSQGHDHTISDSGTHTHGISSDGTHSHGFTTGSSSNLPPYYTVALWLRTA